MNTQERKMQIMSVPNGGELFATKILFNPTTGGLFYRGELYNLSTALKINQVIGAKNSDHKYQVKITFQSNPEMQPQKNSVVFVRFADDKQAMKDFMDGIRKFWGVTEDSEDVMIFSGKEFKPNV